MILLAEVSKRVLERAFARTYSLEMSSVFSSVDMGIGSYRHAAFQPRSTHDQSGVASQER
jgi:hypothetical protein